MNGQSVGVLRRLCSAKLRRLGMDQLMDDVSLLVSELVTNGLRHCEGSSAIRFNALFTASQVLIAVNDHSPVRPVIGAVTEDSESGRGLHIVSALADSWGVTPDGTTTWAVLSG